MKTVKLEKTIKYYYEFLEEYVTYRDVNLTKYIDNDAPALIVGDKYDYVTVSTNIRNKGLDVILVDTTNNTEYQFAKLLCEQGFIEEMDLPNESSGFKLNVYKHYKIILEKFDK